MRKFIFLLIALALDQSVFCQSSPPPKLIVGIVVDQMRYDFLTRFQSNFSENGFKRLMTKGFFAENMHFNYAPTVTGPGHASIYTGTVPAIHGIAANDWLQNGDSTMYCTEDKSVQGIGGDPKSGKMSPKNLLVTTITDQLRLYSNKESKVIGIALKDRGAILPAGHLGNGAYWFDGKTGNWITSDYYMSKLPNWVMEYNSLKRPAELLKSNWDLLLAKENYLYTKQDSNGWEELKFQKETPTFPYRFNSEKRNSDIRFTPFGNTLTNELAIAAIKKENLGRGAGIDFLALSYSSTDIVGHDFGPYSLEIEDTYYRLDRDIANLLSELDAQLGRDQYWIFLTADHGVQDVPGFSRSHKIPAGTIIEKELKSNLNSYLFNLYGIENSIKQVKNEQLYVNEQLASKTNEIASNLNKFLANKLEGIRGFYSFDKLQESPLPYSVKEKMINGFYPNRSGDIAVLLQPNWMSHGQRGTTHGSPYSHDTHIPFLFYGKGVKPTSSSSPYKIVDIAPTLSYLLGILQPNGCIGHPIKELEYLK